MINNKARIGLSVAVMATVLALFLAIAAIAEDLAADPAAEPAQAKPNVCQNLCEAYKNSGCCDKKDDTCRNKEFSWQFKSCQASNDDTPMTDLACKEYEPCKDIQPPTGAKAFCKITCKIGGSEITSTQEGNGCCFYSSTKGRFIGSDSDCKAAIAKQTASVKAIDPTATCALAGTEATAISCVTKPTCVGA